MGFPLARDFPFGYLSFVSCWGSHVGETFQVQVSVSGDEVRDGGGQTGEGGVKVTQVSWTRLQRKAHLLYLFTKDTTPLFTMISKGEQPPTMDEGSSANGLKCHTKSLTSFGWKGGVASRASSCSHVHSQGVPRRGVRMENRLAEEGKEDSHHRLWVGNPK